MTFIYYLVKSLIIILGLISILLGKFLTEKYIMRSKEKIKIIDKKKYIKCSRMTLYFIGLNYLIYGIVIMFFNGMPFIIIFMILIPWIIVISCLIVCRKHLKIN